MSLNLLSEEKSVSAGSLFHVLITRFVTAVIVFHCAFMRTLEASQRPFAVYFNKKEVLMRNSREHLTICLTIILSLS